jgi:MinD superfamily P-loop ATPase
MAYMISEKCIECGSCGRFCKNGAIDWIDHHYMIDPEKCEMCGTCREYCPIEDAIIDAIPFKPEAMIAVNAKN